MPSDPSPLEYVLFIYENTSAGSWELIEEGIPEKTGPRDRFLTISISLVLHCPIQVIVNLILNPHKDELDSGLRNTCTKVGQA